MNSEIWHPAESSGEFAMKKFLVLSMAIAGMMITGVGHATHASDGVATQASGIRK